MGIDSIKDFKLMAHTMRIDIVKMLAEAKSGHPAAETKSSELSVVFSY